MIRFIKLMPRAIVDDLGMVQDTCPGTGPMPAIEDNLNRDPIGGRDDRSGSMTLWFALERAEYLGTV